MFWTGKYFADESFVDETFLGTSWTVIIIMMFALPAQRRCLVQSLMVVVVHLWINLWVVNDIVAV